MKLEKNMAVITTHYNWAEFCNPVRNLHRFVRYMNACEIPLYGIELSLSDKFETSNFKNWTQIKVKKENVCFQKEACINLLEKKIPQEYRKIAWIDHDIFFENTNWYNDTVDKLETHKAAQLFSTISYTNKFGRLATEKLSGIKAGKEIKDIYLASAASVPGGAWAARRELWNNGGLYPFGILGGGDTMFAYTCMGEMPISRLIEMTSIEANPPFLPYIEWKEKLSNYIKKEEVDFIDGKIIHEWHGDRPNRRYNDRYDLVWGMNFSNSLKLDENGLVQISPPNAGDQFYTNIMGYFRGRNEDN